jgi:SAM-dependent methyltransferase
MPPLSPNAWLRWELIRRELEARDPASVLEIGMGQGALAARLEIGRRYVGVEPDERSRAVARQRLSSAATVLADVADVPADATFEVVCAFEVLEHIEDDAGALATWAGHLAPGGRMLLSVPAHRRRFAAADELVGHLRRYDRADLVDRLVEAGLLVERVDAVGFPLGNLLEWGRNAAAGRRLRRATAPSTVTDRTASSGRTLQPPAWAGSATQVATAPFRKAQLPFRASERATGWFAIARAGA